MVTHKTVQDSRRIANRADPVIASASGTHGGEITIDTITKSYGNQQVVNSLSLTVGAGEFFALLGGSGCGKTTTLRIVGGFEHPDSGRILIDGHNITADAPEKRPVTTVFQSYALFPHLSVADNVGFGLRFTDASRAERRRRVQETLELVSMGTRARDKPAKLSGGQQQRVALARALVLRPKVLLLDEPMGALDAKLRKNLQIELRRIQQEVGITFLHVTHDQEEALAMSDRIGIMRDGRLIQVDTPHGIYTAPVDAGIADFIGTANILSIEGETNSPHLLGSRLTRAIDGPLDQWRAVVRPEHLAVEPAGQGHAVGVSGVIVGRAFHGSTTQLSIQCGTDTLTAEHRAGLPPFNIGDPVTVAVDQRLVRVVPVVVRETHLT